MNRYFDIYLNAGNSVPVVINANQYDASETWIFTLYTDDNQQYTPASGSIVGLKSDGHTIANAGTVNSSGQVVITETTQMTASAGINVFELVLDGNHGTANFVVLVEPRPGDNVTPSDSDLSLMEQAIAAAGSIEAVSVLQQAVNNVSSRMEEFIADHAGLANETVLWTGNLYRTWQSSATTPTGGKATLSQEVTDFDYIGVYTTMNTLGNDQTADVHWYNADEFADKPTMVTCGTTKAYSGTTDWVAIPYITLLMDSDEVTCTVFNAGLVSWNGQAESNATAQSSEGSNNYQGSVVKIVGVKNTQTDTEVTDARVGADSTIYSTLKARLDAENSSLKSAINNGIPYAVKIALNRIIQNVAFKNDTDYSSDKATINAWATNISLTSITAVYTQSGTVFNIDPLESLKPDLVVTAHFDNETTAIIDNYDLSGSLVTGTSTITVTYTGNTTAFNVTVTESDAVWTLGKGYNMRTVGNVTYLDITTSNTRAAMARLSADYEDLKVDTGGSAIPEGSGLYPIKIPAGATGIKITPPTDIYVAIYDIRYVSTASYKWERLTTTGYINPNTETTFTFDSSATHFNMGCKHGSAGTATVTQADVDSITWVYTS